MKRLNVCTRIRIRSLGKLNYSSKSKKAYEVLSNPKRRILYDATLPRDETPPSFIKHKVEYSRPNLVHLNEPRLIYVLLEISPREVDQKLPAPPLNLCLVVDRSTSMQGEKMDVVKAAASQLVQTLRSQDIFSVVAFSDRG